MGVATRDGGRLACLKYEEKPLPARMKDFIG